MRGLYAIVDVETLERRGLDPVRFAGAVLDARPAAVQLRDKAGGARRTLELLRAIAPLAAEKGVPFFANDRPDLALLAGCNGVHVGQEDLPVSLARNVAPKLLVGLSTHDEEQVDRALADAPDYIAIGPVFPTTTKDRPSPVVGLERLAAWTARVRGSRPRTPIVAIGGVSLETAREVGAIVDAGAVVAALAAPTKGDAYDAARARAVALHEALGGGAR